MNSNELHEFPFVYSSHIFVGPVVKMLMNCFQVSFLKEKCCTSGGAGTLQNDTNDTNADINAHVVRQRLLHMHEKHTLNVWQKGQNNDFDVDFGRVCPEN